MTFRKKKPLSAKDIAIRRQKHKKVENRRRKRITALLQRLAHVCGCPGADKASILQNALDRLEGIDSGKTQHSSIQQPGQPQEGLRNVQHQMSGQMRIHEMPAMQHRNSMAAPVQSKFTPITTIDPLSTMDEISIVTKPFTLLDSKRMLLLSNFAFRKLFRVEDQGYINLLSLVERDDIDGLQKRLQQCQSGQMESFYQDVRVNIEGEMHVARMFTSMLVSRWHFITLWSVIGKI